MSHAWQDGHERKVQMLRSFLCRDALLAQITVPSLLLAVFLLPLGTGIYAWLPWFPWWAPSLLPLAVLGTPDPGERPLPVPDPVGVR